MPSDTAQHAALHVPSDTALHYTALHCHPTPCHPASALPCLLFPSLLCSVASIAPFPPVSIRQLVYGGGHGRATGDATSSASSCDLDASPADLLVHVHPCPLLSPFLSASPVSPAGSGPVGLLSESGEGQLAHSSPVPLVAQHRVPCPAAQPQALSCSVGLTQTRRTPEAGLVTRFLQPPPLPT